MEPNKACKRYKVRRHLVHLANYLGPPSTCAPVTSGVTTSHLIWVRKLELPAVACPADEGLARLVGQQLQKKLPQLDGAAACRTDGREGVRFFKRSRLH